VRCCVYPRHSVSASRGAQAACSSSSSAVQQTRQLTCGSDAISPLRLRTTRLVKRLFDLRRAPSDFSLAIGVFAGCSAIVLGGGSCPGFGIRRRRVLLA
jgi:hypothetical protein